MSLQNHVILFRHCVRSTSSTVNLHYEWEDLGFERPVSEYTDDVPEYGVPEMWCTDNGLRTARNTGKELLKRIVENLPKGASKKIRFRFVSDSSKRDVDTALELSRGAENYVEKHLEEGGYEVTGLDGQRIDHDMFKPLQSGVCDVSDAEWTRLSKQVERRAGGLSRPSDVSVREALEFFALETGQNDTLDALTELLDDEDDSIRVNKITSRVAGPVNLVKLFAEAALYSRVADGLHASFLPKLDVAGVYALLEWVFYVRAVEETDNVRANAKGVVVARAMLRSLETHWRETSANTHHVTVVVGHDSDLLAVGSALGLRWRLLPPYRGDDADYAPTPPNSGLHLVHDVDSGHVGMSYLFPVLVHEGLFPPESRSNTSGVLESAPVVWDGRPAPSDDPATWLSNFASMDLLRDALQKVLDESETARSCHDNYAARERERDGWWGRTRADDVDVGTAGTTDVDVGTAGTTDVALGESGNKYVVNDETREVGAMVLITIAIILASLLVVKIMVWIERATCGHETTAPSSKAPVDTNPTRKAPSNDVDDEGLATEPSPFSDVSEETGATTLSAPTEDAPPDSKTETETVEKDADAEKTLPGVV